MRSSARDAKRSRAQQALADTLAAERPARSRLARLAVWLSVPTVLAELSSIAMEYIDAAMVGSLGAGATASIGLVAATTWLVGGLAAGVSMGFTVQIAQCVGAGMLARARNTLRQGIVALAAFGLLLMAVVIAVSGPLPRWLGGDEAIVADASTYLRIFALCVPIFAMERLCVGALQASGDMRVPSVLAVASCVLDVAFNFLLIFPTRAVTLLGATFTMPGAGMGVAGAALGTVLAFAIVTVLLMMATCAWSPVLALTRSAAAATGAGARDAAHAGGAADGDESRGDEPESWRLTRGCLRAAVGIATPICVERVVNNGAQIACTAIVAPLGTVSVAANALAVTAESLCYNPGFGIGAAATTLVGQSMGAGRRDLAREFARLTTWLGMATMGAAGAVMFFIAPWVFSLLTPDPAVRELGVAVLRVELIAEPLFGASIVAAGALRGAGDTLVPAVINLGSMWVVRVTAAALLAPRLGLMGVWVAMCGELCVRGALFLVRLYRERWLRREAVVAR